MTASLVGSMWATESSPSLATQIAFPGSSGVAGRERFCREAPELCHARVREAGQVDPGAGDFSSDGAEHYERPIRSRREVEGQPLVVKMKLERDGGPVGRPRDLDAAARICVPKALYVGLDKPGCPTPNPLHA